MTDAQGMLPLPAAEKLFPARRSDFAEWCLEQIRAILRQSPVTSAAAVEWDVRMQARDRVFLCRLARVEPVNVSLRWEAIAPPARCELLAAFSRLTAWCNVHAGLSAGDDAREYLAAKREGRA